jgi:hypothetical protein
METHENTVTTERTSTHLWIIQHCTREGCTTAIRSHDGLPEPQLICKWCKAKEDQGCAFAVYPSHVPHSHHDVTSPETVPKS